MLNSDAGQTLTGIHFACHHGAKGVMVVATDLETVGEKASRCGKRLHGAGSAAAQAVAVVCAAIGAWVAGKDWVIGLAIGGAIGLALGYLALVAFEAVGAMCMCLGESQQRAERGQQ